MNILLAADGSRYTKKALAYLIVNNLLQESGSTLAVLNVQSPLPPHVTRQLDRTVVADYYGEMAEKVLDPIRRFLQRHALKCSVDWTLGTPADEIVRAARKSKSRLIVMGTHGHGVLGSMLMGSVAQRVVAQSPVPVLLVK